MNFSCQENPSAVVAPAQPPLVCPDCGGALILQPKPAHWKIESRKKSQWVYLCARWPACRGLCSAHPDGTPQGTPADKETRRARNLTHLAFDPLWQGAIFISSYHHILKGEGRGAPKRKRALERIKSTHRRWTYQWLADRLGISFDDCHIGLFDIETCRRVYAICKQADPEMIREWAKFRSGR